MVYRVDRDVGWLACWSDKPGLAYRLQQRTVLVRYQYSNVAFFISEVTINIEPKASKIVLDASCDKIFLFSMLPEQWREDQITAKQLMMSSAPGYMAVGTVSISLFFSSSQFCLCCHRLSCLL